MNKVAPLGAVLSSTYHSQYAADRVIDGDLDTLCASTADPKAWVSVLVSSVSDPVVAVYNRNDFASYMRWLSPFEVWVGPSYGDFSSSATMCAKVTLSEEQLQPVPSNERVPVVVRCSGGSGNYVTIRLVDWPSSGGVRYLSLAEVEVYVL